MISKMNGPGGVRFTGNNEVVFFEVNESSVNIKQTDCPVEDFLKIEKSDKEPEIKFKITKNF